MSDELALLITVLDNNLKTTFMVALQTKTSIIGYETYLYWAEPENRSLIAKVIGHSEIGYTIIKVEKIDSVIIKTVPELI